MGKSKKRTKKVDEKPTENKVTEETNGKRPRKQDQFEKICFEEFRMVATKTFSAIDFRPQGQVEIYLQIMYTMLAACFPEKFEDIIVHQPEGPPTVYYNNFTRKEILSPYGIDPAKVKRHKIGTWPGYTIEAPEPVKEPKEPKAPLEVPVDASVSPESNVPEPPLNTVE